MTTLYDNPPNRVGISRRTFQAGATSFRFCTICGATLLEHEDIDAVGLHMRWHKDQAFDIETLRKRIQYMRDQLGPQEAP